MGNEDFVNGFRMAILCLDSFWDNIELYSESPIIQNLDEDTKGELKDAVKMWSDSYLKTLGG